MTFLLEERKKRNEDLNLFFQKERRMREKERKMKEGKRWAGKGREKTASIKSRRDSFLPLLVILFSSFFFLPLVFSSISLSLSLFNFFHPGLNRERKINTKRERERRKRIRKPKKLMSLRKKNTRYEYI